MLFRVLTRLESSLATILIQGESGSGKELVARAIHARSPVHGGPFVAINCASTDRSLVRSELFGHRRGAFTGATEATAGSFQAADGGTLFLDEIAELPIDVQPVLLRALETRSITRVGESEPRLVNVRLLSATNRDLLVEAAAGRFRRDLYHRLAVIKVDVPPLRGREEDLVLLSRTFAQEFGIAPLDEGILCKLRGRKWPGNVRELRNTLEAFAVLGTLPSEEADPDELERLLGQVVDYRRPYTEQKEELIEAFTRLYLRGLLSSSRGNRSRAARVAGLHRAYLGKLTARLGLENF